MPDAPLLNVQIDGTWYQFPKGTRLIEACAQVGKFIPRYCYHPKLSSPGNCRMCLIEMGMPKMGPDRKPVLGEDGTPEINWMPRPQISCAQEICGRGIQLITGLPSAPSSGLRSGPILGMPISIRHIRQLPGAESFL